MRCQERVDQARAGAIEPADEDRAFASHPLDLNLLPDVAKSVERAGRYAEAFGLAFGSSEVTTERIAQAIGTYVRTIRSSTACPNRIQRSIRPA